jgi:hypothetical protein
MFVHRRYLASLAAAVALFATPLHAQDIQQDTGLVCDTVEEVDSVMAVYDKSGDWHAALVGINATNVVCAVATVAFYKGKTVKQITTKQGTFDEVEILVVGVPTTGGLRTIPPEKQITLFVAPGDNT